MATDTLSSPGGKYLYGDVAASIREMIRRGEVKPGERLPSERVLAERLNVSRNSLRQAIQHLAERKVLRSRRGDGTYVCAPEEVPVIESFGEVLRVQRDLVREVLEFRRLVEPGIAALAAAHITREELNELKIIVCDQERMILAERDDCELDAAFHLALAVASRNRVVGRLMETVNDILDESRTDFLRSSARREASVVGHLRIIDALENGDARRASEAMQEHLEAVERIILEDGEKVPENEKTGPREKGAIPHDERISIK